MMQCVSKKNILKSKCVKKTKYYLSNLSAKWKQKGEPEKKKNKGKDSNQPLKGQALDSVATTMTKLYWLKWLNRIMIADS